MLKNKLLLTWLLCFGMHQMQAQTDKALGTIKSLTETLEIEQGKDGKLYATTKRTEEIELNTTEGAQLLSQKNIYHGYYSQLGDVKAYTIKKLGKKTKKIPYLKKKTTNDKSGNYVFYEDSKLTKITYGGLEPQASTYLEYTINHRDIHLLPTMYFQRFLNAENITYTIIVPKTVDIRFEKKLFGIEHLEYEKVEGRNNVTHTFKAINMPKHETQDYAPSASYYLPHIIPIVQSYKDKKGSVYPVLGSTQDLYNYYRGFIDKVDQAAPKELLDLSAKIVAGATNEEEKVKKIFKWVQENIKYVAFEDGIGGFQPRMPSQVCAKKYGDCKDMASLLVVLLRAQKVKAYHTWIGTRSIPYSYQEVPTPSSDNHMICAVDMNNTWYFLDATNSEIPFGIIPSNLQNKEALIGISKDKYKIQKLPFAPTKQNYVSDTTWLQIDGEKVTGNIKYVTGGYRAYDIRSYIEYKDQEERKKYVKAYLYRGNNKAQVDSVSWTFPTEHQVALKGQFTNESFIQKVGDDIYIDLFLKKIYKDFRIDDLDKRIAMVDNDWANSIRYVTYLKIPAGYELAYKPKNQKEKEAGHYDYELDYSVDNNVLCANFYIQYDLAEIEKNKLQKHNELIEKLNSFYKEVIQLKRK